MSTNVYAKFCCAVVHIKKALWLFRELITTTRSRSQSGFLGLAFQVQKLSVYLCHSEVVLCRVMFHILE